jgi:NAD(P)-dependent dehydrogenase (short-subunit alcohol dehydrogenase family)
MRLLVLGGTKYLGRHVVELALAEGHDVTLFNRGRTGPGLSPGVPRLTGDRSSGDPAGLAAPATGEWDGFIAASRRRKGRKDRQTARVMGGGHRGADSGIVHGEPDSHDYRRGNGKERDGVEHQPDTV